MISQADTDDRERAIVNSAVWAAAGDALGWITELGREETVRARAGTTRVDHPVAWKRGVGGRFGVRVEFPSGTYSDDTQLRLAVCRAIRGNGVFDAEAFARVELTVWQSYALGAGRGSKAAAANLTKRGSNWFSNFFESKQQNYVRSGGNGAAMRVQPHAWVSPTRTDELLTAVIRDAVITHGHPRGFLGAVFHALTLADAVQHRLIPEPSRWDDYIQLFESVTAAVSRDRQLEAFWRPAWERKFGATLPEAIRVVMDEARQDLSLIANTLQATDDAASYRTALTQLGCFDEASRGSGIKTAIAANALAWIFSGRPVRAALITGANELESDTDTIGTMAGALLGATTNEHCDWQIQDRDYIEVEARRLAAVGRGEMRDSFAYPDLAKWTPPTTHSDAVIQTDTGLAVIGLGRVTSMSEMYKAGDNGWQWLKLPFGQTILAKRKLTDSVAGKADLLPPLDRRLHQAQLNLPTSNAAISQRYGSNNSAAHGAGNPISMDEFTDRAIKSDFNDTIIGELLNRCMDESIESAVAFSAIIAKAKIARRRRKQS